LTCSIFRHLEVEQGAILLAAEDVGIAGAAARQPAVHREFDRQGRVEFDMIGELSRIDAEDRQMASRDSTPLSRTR
jgi:hypothetical protein